MTDQRPETIPLGTSDVRITRLGIGTWAWGDRFFWGFGQGYDEGDVEAAFHTSLAAGLNFIDTAEFYGFGRSEKLVGQFVRHAGRPVVVATKFFPFPWRVRRGDLLRALQASLERLGVDRTDLYQMHWPYSPAPIETWMDAMADAVEAGLTRAVGVSNYNPGHLRRAHAALARRGVSLASNQVQYSLLDRRPERTGLLQACRELGVTLIAYSPLGQGLLTGKYTPAVAPPGVRRFRYNRRLLTAVQPLVALLREIGAAHGGKTPGQVALNWVIGTGAVPIPGAKTARQAGENAGALGWHLTDDQIAALEEESDRVQ